MTEITRTVEQLVADVDVDDDGYITVHVTQPLTVDEARDAAAAIMVAAQRGEDYLAEQTARAAETASAPRCLICQGAVETDAHSTSGWRHVSPLRATHPVHVARVDEADL